MKWLIFIISQLPVLMAQDVAEPLNGALVLEKRTGDNDVVLADLFRRVGSPEEFDLIVVVYGEHMARASVLGFKGVSTGFIDFDGNRTSRSELVYIPHDASEGELKMAEKITQKQDPHKYDKLVELAWNLLSGSKIGVQSENLNNRNEVLRTCYYFVSSRLFDKSAAVAMLGGYIQNPQKGSKSEKFLDGIHDLIADLSKPPVSGEK